VKIQRTGTILDNPSSCYYSVPLLDLVTSAESMAAF